MILVAMRMPTYVDVSLLYLRYQYYIQPDAVALSQA